VGPAALEGLAVSILSLVLTLCVAAASKPDVDPESQRAGDAAPTLIVVVGAAGEAGYGKIFEEEAALWRTTAKSSGARLHLIGGSTPTALPAGATPPAEANDKSRLLNILDLESKDSPAAVWLILIGHGTFDGRTAAFNLVGPDLSSEELTKALAGVPRPLVVVNTTAASAPFLTALSAPGRAVVTATKSGQERNYARFGRYFARRVADPAADLDKDEQTSLFEAWLAAAHDTAEFYKGEGRIATEHPLLDDDGDAKGVRPEFFQRGKLVKRPKGEAAADGESARRLHLKLSAADLNLTADQLQERNRLETELTALRRRKAEMEEDAYFTEPEKLLIPLAKLARGVDEVKPSAPK
jgi:hypothetical protein